MVFWKAEGMGRRARPDRAMLATPELIRVPLATAAQGPSELKGRNMPVLLPLKGSYYGLQQK